MNIEKLNKANETLRKIKSLESGIKEITKVIGEIEYLIEESNCMHGCPSYDVRIIYGETGGYNIEAINIIGSLRQTHKTMLRELDELSKEFASL